MDSAIAGGAARFGECMLIAAALARAPWGYFPPEERAWIRRIEAVRRANMRSNKVISYTDYGARDPGDVLSAAEMERGLTVQRKVSSICRIASKGRSSCALLFSLVRQLRPQSCVEMGTCLGISSSYIAAGLTLNGSGVLVTLEGSAEIANVARENFASLQLNVASIVVGPFHETMQLALSAAAPVDFMFVDGHHDEQATKRYFSTALDFLAESAVIVFDDINWSDGMKKAWAAIASDPRSVWSFAVSDFGIVLIQNQNKHGDWSTGAGYRDRRPPTPA